MIGSMFSSARRQLDSGRIGFLAGRFRTKRLQIRRGEFEGETRFIGVLPLETSAKIASTRGWLSVSRGDKNTETLNKVA